MTRIGYAAGAFDLFHVGHLNLLQRAKENCDFLIAGVVSDDIVLAKKGVRTFVPTEDRASIVSAIRYVDSVHIESTPDKLEIWDDLRFTHFFKGDDWLGTEKGRHLEEKFRSVGVNVMYFPYTDSISSTALRHAVRQHAEGVRDLASVDPARRQKPMHGPR
jgi:glycerol-3-phosphate cytidylyltransferase